MSMMVVWWWERNQPNDPTHRPTESLAGDIKLCIVLIIIIQAQFHPFLLRCTSAVDLVRGGKKYLHFFICFKKYKRQRWWWCLVLLLMILGSRETRRDFFGVSMVDCPSFEIFLLSSLPLPSSHSRKKGEMDGLPFLFLCDWIFIMITVIRKGICVDKCTHCVPSVFLLPVPCYVCDDGDERRYIRKVEGWRLPGLLLFFFTQSS